MCYCIGGMWRSDSELVYEPWMGLKTLEFSLPSTLHGCCCLGPKNRIDVVAEIFLFTSAIMRDTEPPGEIYIPKSPLQQMMISVSWNLWRHICKCPECSILSDFYFIIIKKPVALWGESRLCSIKFYYHFYWLLIIKSICFYCEKNGKEQKYLKKLENNL